MKMIIIIILFNLFLCISTDQEMPQCLIPNNNERLDCFPQPNANQNDCQSRGCCWYLPRASDKNSKNEGLSIPYCYYPTNYQNYFFDLISKSDRRLVGKLNKKSKSYLPNDILSLDLEVIYETNSRVRIRITDPRNKRFEVPLKHSPPDIDTPLNSNYEIIIPSNQSFSLEIRRKSDNLSLFKSFGPLLYSDQFIQLTSKMSIDKVYGIGEQNRPFLHQLSNGWTRIGLWARDNMIETYTNLYGTHPFYMGMPDDGKAFGVFYLNSNAQEFVLQPAPSITYRTTGGILDIFVFTGGTPEETVKQYTNLIGKPMLPPYWSLGFHLSRYGYKSLMDMSETLQRNINSKIPVDVQWCDIDYMDGFKDFTINQKLFNNSNTFVKSIRERFGIRFVPIIDPTISSESKNEYLPFSEGLEMNIFVRKPITNEILIGSSWAGKVAYPDFSHPNITKYWLKQNRKFHNSISFDGLWIDMNEPSNFEMGSLSGCPGNSPYDYPFFVPEIRDNSLIAKTICSSALHYNNERHYNLHNLYGYTESVITYKVLNYIFPNKRQFILSRSTFSGSGKYTFHWTGDNVANWDHLRNSIRQILNFNMFGIPMTGADICGFIGQSNEELCIRWMQLGAFYPFMRNHNAIGERDQDPAAWSQRAQDIMKTAINIRYSLLPNMYTLLVKSYLYGGTVMRPMSFEFFSDKTTHSLDLQFMLGSSLMVIPVVHEGAININAYFPAGIWYDFFSGQILHCNTFGSWKTLNVSIDTIYLAIRGGEIISLLKPANTAELSRNNDITLYCVMNEMFSCKGELYWDDGQSIESYNNYEYSYIRFSVDGNTFSINPDYIGYGVLPKVNKIMIIGLEKSSINQVTVNNIAWKFNFNSQISSISLEDLGLSLDIESIIKWT